MSLVSKNHNRSHLHMTTKHLSITSFDEYYVLECVLVIHPCPTAVLNICDCHNGTISHHKWQIDSKMNKTYEEKATSSKLPNAFASFFHSVHVEPAYQTFSLYRFESNELILSAC